MTTFSFGYRSAWVHTLQTAQINPNINKCLREKQTALSSADLASGTLAELKNRAPRYRIEREASQERAWQQLVNVFRRLAGLRINRTGRQAYDDHLKQAVRP